MNRFKGLDLIRAPEELWTCTAGGDQNQPREKEMQEGKVVIWGGLSGEKKRRERQRRNGKIHPTLEFPRTTRRDKKAFLSEECKEIEENEWERLEISSRNLEISWEHFMQEWARKKDRNSKNLTEAEEIKKRWQEYAEELYRKGLNDLDNHDGVITSL